MTNCLDAILIFTKNLILSSFFSEINRAYEILGDSNLR